MRLWGGLVALAVLLLGVAPAGAAPKAAVPVLVIDGRGFGHGVGMAQDGAYWMARAGSTMPQIISHFYPGTTLGKATGNVRVVVLPGPGQDADMLFPAGGEVRDVLQGQQSTGFPVTVHAGETVHIHFDGQTYSVEGGAPRPEGTARATSAGTDEPQARVAAAEESTTTTSTEASSSSSTSTTVSSSTTQPDPLSTAVPTTVPGVTTTTEAASTTAPSTTTITPPSTTANTAPARAGPLTSSPRTLWAVPAGKDGTVTLVNRNRAYRGVIEAMSSATDLRLVNQVDVETYLKGMGEVRDPSWPQPALRTQAVAARTYAMRAMAAGGEICDDTHCQVYLGAEAEYPAMNKAVEATAKQVVLFNKSLASTVYSSNGGGFSATPQEGFGTTGDGFPYLTAAPYKSDNPLPWTVKVALTDVAGRFGYKGQVTDVKLAAVGPSGRALSVELDGDKGALAVPGLQFARSLGLKSTLVALHTESAEAPPPPPPDVSQIQAPPDEAAQQAAVTAAAGAEAPIEAPDVRPVFGLPAQKVSALPLRPPGDSSPAGPIAIVLLLLVAYGVISMPKPGSRPRGRHFRHDRIV